MKLLDLQRDPAEFRASLLIDTDRGPTPFSEVMDDWQAADFTALDPGWLRAVQGVKTKAQYQRGWLERPRGHAKTLDLAIMATWALFASRRQLSGIGAAGDLDQARLLRDAVGKLIYVNPWLGQILEVQNNRVSNVKTGSTLDIITSDAPTSYGLTPDFVIADEVVHWRKRDLWDSLISSAAKRSTCLFVSITNAGLQDDWAWQAREAVRSDPGWYFSRLDGPQASWITPDRLAEQERLLPPIAYRRLWLNEWSSGGGDALSPEVIDYAFQKDLRPQSGAVQGYAYVGGLDLGVSRDASAVCVLGVKRSHSGHGLIRLAFTRVWRPRRGQKVNLQDVEDALVQLHGRFTLKQLNYDPWQAMHMASRLQSGGFGKLAQRKDPKARLPVAEVTSTSKNLQAMATALLEAFNDRRLELYEDSDLRRDLTRLRVEERSYGFRLTSPHDELGHGDLGTAFSLALLAATDLAAKRVLRAGALFSEKTDGAGPGKPAWQRDLERMRKDRERMSQADDPRLEKMGEMFRNFGRSYLRRIL